MVVQGLWWFAGVDKAMLVPNHDGQYQLLLPTFGLIDCHQLLPRQQYLLFASQLLITHQIYLWGSSAHVSSPHG